jgi:hypothetical protein
MTAKEKFWQELSELLGRDVNPESDLEDDPTIWEALSPGKKEQVSDLLAIAMHSPNLMFSDQSITSSCVDLPDIELPLWKDIIPATPAGIAHSDSARLIRIGQLPGSAMIQRQNFVGFPARLASSPNFGGIKHKSYAIAKF